MTTRQHTWFIPVALFGWAAACIGKTVEMVINGEFQFRWTDGTESILVRPDTRPFLFWICVLVSFFVGIVSAGGGIVLLKAFLRKRKTVAKNHRENLVNVERAYQFQSKEFKDVLAHLTDAERQILNRWTWRAGMWMLPLFGFGFSIVAVQGNLRMILAVVWVLMFLASVAFVMHSLAKFYCSTVWGRKHGYSQKTWRFFSWSKPARKL